MGLGLNSWPMAADTATKIRVAGPAHTAVRGSSFSVGDSGQLPELTSLLTATTTVESVVVSLGRDDRIEADLITLRDRHTGTLPAVLGR